MKKKIFNIVFYFLVNIFSAFMMGNMISTIISPLFYLFGSIFFFSSALLLYHFVTLIDGDFD